jgi:hypothetical protein
MSLLNEMLIISQLKESAGSDTTTLTNLPEFKELAKADPAFAKNLILAWKGDSAVYAKSAGKTKDLLFPLLFKKDYLDKKGQKFAELPHFKQIISALAKVYAKTFPQIPEDARIDVGVWHDVKWKRAYESAEEQAEYDMLREELLS